MQFFLKTKLNIWAVIIAALLFCPSFLFAAERVIESAEAKLIMNFNEGLNIADSDSLRIVYTGSATDPSALLRDSSGNPSYWGGSFWSNYGVIFLNPNGITIGANANIQAASFIASTLNLTDDNFLHPEKYNNSYIFSKWIDKTGKSVINNGYIKVSESGQAVLLGSAAANAGTIEAILGSAALAAGEAITLGLDSAGMISVIIDQAVQEEIFTADGQKLSSAIENSGTILADGGKVVLAAKVLNKVFDYAINNSGVIQAKSVVSRNGVIELVASGAPIYNIGKIEAGEVKVITDSGFINIGNIITDGYEGLPNGGRISIEAATILQQGKISANAYEEGTAGEVIIVSQTSTTVDSGSTTEAMALGLVGNGGRILIDSLSGNTQVNTLAVIDVSAGAISGNAGFIEVSAFDQLGFYGVLSGRAPPGFLAADVYLKTDLPFDTFLLGTSSLFLSGEISAENIIVFTNQRIRINAILTAQNTIQVDSQGADISGTFSAKDTTFNMHDGDTELGPINQSGELSPTDNGNITVVGNITVTNGTITIKADNDNTSGGNFIQNAGTVISTTGSNKNIIIRSGSNDDKGTGNVAIGTISATGDLRVTAFGGYIRRNSDAVGVTADKLRLIAQNIGQSDSPLITNVNRLESAIISSGTGGIYLNENNGLDVNTLEPNGSETIINNLAGNLKTLKDIDTLAGSLTLTSAENLTVGDKASDDITAGAGAVNLIADSDGIGGGTLSFNSGVTVSSSKLHRLQGANSFDIGTTLLNRLTGGATALTIKSTAGNITVTNPLSKSAGIDLRAAGNLSVNNNLTASGGSIILYADNDDSRTGNFSQADATLIDAGSDVEIRSSGDTTVKNVVAGENIDITVNSDLTVGTLTAIDKVTLTANSGSIYGDGSGTTNVIAPVLYLDVLNDIGKDDYEIADGEVNTLADRTLYTRVDELYAYAGGDIGLLIAPGEVEGMDGYFDPAILNEGGLDLIEIEANRASIQTAGDITVGVIEAVEAVGLVADGSINGDGITEPNITAPILFLEVSENIGNTAILLTNIDELYTNAGGSIYIGDTASLTLVEVRGGFGVPEDVEIYADGDIYVGYVSDPVRVLLQSYNGSIIGELTNDLNIDTENLYLYVAQSIRGDSSPEWSYFGYENRFLSTNASYIKAVDGRASKSVSIYAKGPATVNIDAPSVDYVQIVADGTINVDYIYNPNKVILEAYDGSIVGQNEAQEADITTANLYLYATGSIYGYYSNPPAPGYLLTQIDSLNAQAGILIKVWDIGTEIYDEDLGEDIPQLVTLNNVQTNDALDLSIDIVTTYDMQVGYVHDLSDVTLTSLYGSIIGLDNEGPNIQTSYLTLSANNGSIYGAYNPYDNHSYLVTAAEDSTATAADSIYVYNLSSINLWGIQADGAASIDIISEGNMYVWAPVVEYGAGNIDLTAIGEGNVSLEVYSPISSTSGDITLKAINTVEKYSDDYYFYDDSSNYAEILVYNTEISSQTGDISLRAINRVDFSFSGDDVGEYDDESVNYAKVSVLNDEGETISTTGDINLSATNTVDRDIYIYYLDYTLYDYSENYAEVRVTDTLDTRNEDGTGTGAINITATNTVNNTIYVEDEIYYDYDYEPVNYAYIYVNSPYGIQSDLGDITLSANNSVTNDIDIYYIDDYYYDYSTNYTKVEVYYTPIYSLSGDITLEAVNTLTNDVSVEDEIDDDYEDYSENYAKVYVYNPGGGTISTMGNIDISATNSADKDVYIYYLDYCFYDYSSNYAEIYLYDTLDTSLDGTSEGIINLTATNTVRNTVTVEDETYYDYDNGPENYAYIYVNDYYGGIRTDLGDITLSADNSITNNIDIYYIDDLFYDYSDNYAEVYVDNTPVYSASGNISLEAINNVDNTVIVNAEMSYEYDDGSENYAYIRVNNGGGDDVAISTTGNIDISADNTVIREISADNMDDYYWDYSSNYAYISVYDTLDTTSDGASPGSITIAATNSVDNTLTVADYLYDYYDESKNYAEVYLYSPYSISTDTGDISITVDNTFIRNISAGYIDYIEDYTYNYAYVDLYYTPIYSLSGAITLAADNAVHTTVTAVDPLYGEGGIYYHTDGSYNYAEVYVYNPYGTTISTIGDIDISADNTVIRNITADSIDDYYWDYSSNYAYVDIYDTLDTTGDWYYDAETDEEYYIDGTGAISLTANNTFIRNISAGYIDYIEDYTYNYAYVDLYYTPIHSSSGNISLSSTNTVDTQVTATNDGEGRINEYYDESYNDAKVYVYNPSGLTISTQGHPVIVDEELIDAGGITLSATNTVTRDIAADYIDDYYDNSYNRAYVYVYDTLTTTPEGAESTGEINLSALNDITIVVNGSIGDYYDGSYNYAEVYASSSDTILTDQGDVSLTAANTVTRNITANSIGGIGGYDYSEEYDYDNDGDLDYYYSYWYDDSYNYASVELSDTPIYSRSGNINLAATNSIDTTLAVTNDAEGTIYDYNDNSDNYAQVDVYNGEEGTLSTLENITLTATNNFASDVTADFIESLHNDFGASARIYVYDTLTTTPEDAASSGEINLTATNSVTSTITAEVGESEDDSYGYAEISLGYSDTLLTDSGDINLNATSTGSGYQEADIYIGTPIISNSGNVNVNAQADDYAHIDIENYDYAYEYFYRYYYYPEGYGGSGYIPESENGKITTDSGNITLNASATEGSEAYIDVFGPVSSNSGNINLTANGSDEAGIEIFGGTRDYDDNSYYEYYYYGGFYWDDYQSDYTYYYNGEIDTITGNINLLANSDTNAYINVNGPVSSDSGIIEMNALGSSINVSTESSSSSDSYYNEWDYGYYYGYQTQNNLYTNTNAGSIDNGSGDINLNAIPNDEDPSTINITGTVSTDTGAINMQADDYTISGDTIISDSGDITLENAVSVRPVALGYNSEEDDLEIDAAEIARIITGGLITIGSETAGPITVSTADFTGRNLSLISGDEINDLVGAETIIADILTLSAATGIGTADNPLNTDVDTLSASTTEDGAGIYIDEDDGIGIAELTTNGSATITANGSSTLGSITTGGDFSFTTSNGAITVLSGTVESLTGGIDLAALNGSIIAIGPGPHLIATADSLLEASGVIASSLAPLNVLLTGGDLSVAMGGTIGGVSGALSGATPSGTILLNNIPPGIVYFNGLQLWPSISGGSSELLASQQNANALLWRFILPYLEQLGRYQINTFNSPGGPVFFYHPLTPMDISAFDALTLDDDAYRFLNGSINIIGHDGLLPFLMR